ncbi:MAG: SulP family inorganic anion transporter [Pacificimonas sp.]
MKAENYLPPLRWLKTYSAASAGADLLAGAILAVLLVPQAMAYALLAGLPPEVGLYTAIAPPLVYAMLGTSSYASMGPVALASLLVADAIGTSDLPATQAAAIIAVEVGVILIVLGVLRLGRLVNFISDPALLGFTAAAAVLIAASQLPALLGVEAERAGTLSGVIEGIAPMLSEIHFSTLLLGGGALALLLLGDRFGAAGLWKLGVRPPWRTALVKSIPLLVLIGAAVVAALFVPGTETVREPPSGLPPITFPPFAMDAWLSLAMPSVVIAIVVFVTGTAVAKSLAGRRRQALDTSQEAIAIGAASVAGALTGGYAPGVSLSRSALVYDSGGQTPLASGVAAIIVMIVALFFAAPLAMLPTAALAALVMSAVFSLVKARAILSTWRHSKIEGGVFLVTLAGTLFLGVQWGLAAGTAAGVVAFLWFSSLPRVTRLGTVEGEDRYRSILRDDVETVDSLPVLAIRIDRSIYFGNVGHCEDQLLTLLQEHPDAQCLLIDMKSVNDVDSSGLSMLSRLVEHVEEKKLTVGFAEVHEHLKPRLNRAHELRACESYHDVSHGVEEMAKTCGRSENGALPR